ncbi:MAG: Gfo/Idh/MocA family oxidoreductase [Candidatus Eremiobacteraeota bacterium]|nr:Gfo/Idh/MocA family oxidoreductase [Candidatus Eremiobacteraeota bacterium]
MPLAKLRAGLYGAGAFGRFLLQTLRDSEDLQITALANRTYERGLSAAREYGISTVHRSYEALLSDEALEAIIVATPPADHGVAVLSAVQAGKHVFVEKPLAITLESAQRILQAAAGRARRVAIDYPMIYTPLVEAMQLFRSSRLAGRLIRVALENVASCEGLEDDHWFWNRNLSGGIFVEHGVHFFDWCGALLAEPTLITAMTAVNGLREDRVFAAVQHADGALATYFHAFITTPKNERTRTMIAFESLDVTLDGWIPTVMRLAGPSAVVATTTIRRMLHRSVESTPHADAGFIFNAGPKQEVYANGVRAAASDFVRAVREPGYIPRNDVTRAYESLRVAVAARTAAANGISEKLSAGRPALTRSSPHPETV